MLSRMEASPISGDDTLPHDQLQVVRLRGRRARPRDHCARHMGGGVLLGRCTVELRHRPSEKSPLPLAAVPVLVAEVGLS